jgi:hypothetical protein
VLTGEIVIPWRDPALSEQRTCDLGQSLGQEAQAIERSTEARRPIVGVQQGRVDALNDRIVRQRGEIRHERWPRC